MFRRHACRPDVLIGVIDLDRMAAFFRGVGWHVERDPARAVVTGPGGRFGLESTASPPRLELALSVPDPLHVDELAGVVEVVGGIIMEPPQETTWGGWGFSFNDPEGNTWEIGSPFSVAAVDLYLTTGVRPVSGPIVAVSVPRPSPVAG